MEKYFVKVREAQRKIFDSTFIKKTKNINIIPMRSGDLNDCEINFFKDFLRSDFYLVFGSSYIKGKLADFLIKQNYDYIARIDCDFIISKKYLENMKNQCWLL